MKIAPLAAALLTLCTSSAFTLLIPTVNKNLQRNRHHHRHLPIFATAANSTTTSPPSDVEETFYQAVKLAEQGWAAQEDDVDIDELDRLATELEKFRGGCIFEHREGEDDSSPAEFAEYNLCEKEIQDRIDVAEILRMKIELQLRMDYLKRANLFADDVKKEHDAIERKKLKEALIANREKSPSAGSDLGLL